MIIITVYGSKQVKSISRKAHRDLPARREGKGGGCNRVREYLISPMKDNAKEGKHMGDKSKKDKDKSAKQSAAKREQKAKEKSTKQAQKH